jgi:hypothetical protein
VRLQTWFKKKLVCDFGVGVYTQKLMGDSGDDGEGGYATAMVAKVE